MPGLFASAERTTSDLRGTLQRVFGHADFRAHQREVCEAAASGRDVLLVMPTGAGKSLCYQLPALALGGTALVVSPLIALMDDQASKLTALGLRVARIHSGLSRETARQACRDYLNGALNFLFIAPERMRVPGFPEMLAKRKPALLAIDEAHCISQWGHDFRPDYRTLGQHLPALRPAPIVALTATATPTVQRDIAAQLRLAEPATFITGFRRNNLHVEVHELSKPQREQYTIDLLREPDARPAIVYAPSRKAAEELAAKLNANFPARAYHAGLEPGVRESVQTAFLTGKLEVVVATIAFGMGVDKPDVRTVVHTALPGSVEAYYQEIGRAGRDGEPSRTVLLYSFADRKTQEFFLERSYPARTELERVAAALDDVWVEPEQLARQLRLDGETLGRILDKLFAQGVADVDRSGNVRGTGESSRWQSGYDAQVNARREQIDRMMAFAEGHSCRMAALVHHFGDTSDQRAECGACDVCWPIGRGHTPDQQEREHLRSILLAVAARGVSTGKLFTETNVTRDRKQFDIWLGALARAGLVTIANDTFRNAEGSEVTYRKVTITYEGRSPDAETLATVLLPDAPDVPLAKGPAHKARPAKDTEEPLSTAQQALEDRLRAWRLEQARAAGKPPFIVFGDSTLRAMARVCPRTLRELGGISGIGPQKLETYGAAIVAMCRETVASSEDETRVTKQTGTSRKAIRTTPVSVVEKSVPKAQTHAVKKPERTFPSSRPALQQPSSVARSLVKELTAAQLALQTRLQGWRSEQAREAGLPSFFILSDTLVRELAVAAPQSVGELAAIHGLGAEKIERFGEAVLTLCRAAQ